MGCGGQADTFISISRLGVDLEKDSIPWHRAYSLALPVLDCQAARNRKTAESAEVIQGLMILLFFLTSAPFRNMFCFQYMHL